MWQSALLKSIAISIHAPTRGATDFRLRQKQNREISIHDPTRGATIILAVLTALVVDFNPRSHEGSD